MIYVYYEHHKRKLIQTQLVYDEKLAEKVNLLANGEKRKLKKINETLNELRSSMEERERLLKATLDELERSKDIEDTVYRLRYIDGMKVSRISRIVHYSDTQVYRILQNIKETVRCSQLGRK